MNSSTQLDNVALLLQHQLIASGLSDDFDETLGDMIDNGKGWEATEEYATLVDTGVSFINQRLNTRYIPFGMKAFKLLHLEHIDVDITAKV